MTELDVNLKLGEALNVFAGVGVQLDQTVKQANRTNERLWNKLQFGTPVTARRAKAAVYPSSGNLVIDVAKPELGEYYDIESVTVGGTDFNITAAGTAGLYVFGTSNNQSPGLTNGVDYAASLPNAGFYGFRDIVLNDNDRLIVVIFGGTPGQTYCVNMVATVYNVAAALGDTFNAGA